MAFKAIPVTAAKVAATLSNFPAYVKPSAMTGWGALTLAEAQSSRWYADADMIVELPREIVAADEIHTLVDSINTTTIIYTDYDGIRADYAVTDTYGRNAVWVDYDLVVHLEENANDSTDSGFNGTAVGDLPTNITGKLGGGQDFDGNDSYDMGDQTAFDIDDAGGIDKTLQAWFRTDVTPSNHAILGKWGSTFSQRNWLLRHESGGTVRLFTGSGGSTGQNVQGTATTPINTWGLVHVTWDASENDGSIFTNGGDKVTNVAMTTVAASTAKLGIGSESGGVTAGGSASNYAGIIDEVRVRSSILSDDWIETEYNNQSDVGAFWGTVTDVGGGGTEYELVCDTAAFTLTGVAATLALTRTVEAEPASFALSGQATALSLQRVLSLVPGSFSLLGTDTGLLRAYEIATETGAFALSGQAATFPRAYTFSVDPGAFAATGIDAALSAELQLIATPGAFTFTGQDAVLGRMTVLDLDTGTVLLTGIDAQLARRFGLAADAGGFVLTGVPSTILAQLTFDLETGSYVLIGNDIETTVASILNPYCPIPRPYTAAAAPYAQADRPYTPFPPGNCP